MPANPSIMAKSNESNSNIAVHNCVELVVRQIEKPSGPLPPISPGSEKPCSGWTCLTEAQQAGIIVCITVVFVVFAFAILFFLRSKKKKKAWKNGDFVLIRRGTRRRRGSRTRSIIKSPTQRFSSYNFPVIQQPPQTWMTLPTILHIPPPPPPPVPVPIPIPTPMPVPFPQPQPIYPATFQPYQHHSSSAQAHTELPLQPTPPFPMFPVNFPGQQSQQHCRAQFQPRPWTNPHGPRGHQEPPNRRPPLAHRLFGMFNPHGGRASTIASSDYGSPRMSSSVNVKTSIGAPSPSETRDEKNKSRTTQVGQGKPKPKPKETSHEDHNIEEILKAKHMAPEETSSEGMEKETTKPIASQCDLDTAHNDPKRSEEQACRNGCKVKPVYIYEGGATQLVAHKKANRKALKATAKIGIAMKTNSSRLEPPKEEDLK
ncbi:uncharacterized protein CTRU02_213663 [Colletotrichum truncatum]|uniref:Uncharacterized protein n=1 Tax=Colletotrichum truncatum TaxID=5467 RepID=A0ACC3YGE8_COLTU